MLADPPSSITLLERNSFETESSSSSSSSSEEGEEATVSRTDGVPLEDNNNRDHEEGSSATSNSPEEPYVADIAPDLPPHLPLSRTQVQQQQQLQQIVANSGGNNKKPLHRQQAPSSTSSLIAPASCIQLEDNNNQEPGNRASKLNTANGDDSCSDTDKPPPVPPHRERQRDTAPTEPPHPPLSRKPDPPQPPAVPVVTNGVSVKKPPHRRAYSTASSLNAPPRVTVNRTATITRLPSIPERTFRYQRIEIEDPLPVSSVRSVLNLKHVVSEY